MVNPKTSTLEHTLALPCKAACALFTQKHLIVSLEDGVINWYKLDLPAFSIAKEDDGSKKLTVTEDIEQEWNLNKKIGETSDYECIAHMHYSRSFRQIVMGT